MAPFALSWKGSRHVDTITGLRHNLGEVIHFIVSDLDAMALMYTDDNCTMIWGNSSAEKGKGLKTLVKLLCYQNNLSH